MPQTNTSYRKTSQAMTEAKELLATIGYKHPTAQAVVSLTGTLTGLDVLAELKKAIEELKEIVKDTNSN